MKLSSLIYSYRDQYKATLKLAAPVLVSNMGQVTVQLADSIMVGSLGAVPQAGVSFAMSVFFLFFALGLGVSLGLTPIVGKAFAQGRHRDSALSLQNSLVLNTAIGVLLVVCMFACIPLFTHMGQDPAVVEASKGFYRYLAWSVLPFMVFAAFKQFLEGIGITRVEMNIVIVANVINIALCWLLIYGKWIFPEMGAAGAGLANLVTRSFMAAAIIVYFFCKYGLRRYFAFFSRAGVSLLRLRENVAVGFPIGLQMLMETSSFALTAIMMGWFGAVALAAHQIAMTAAHSTFMAIVSISVATTIRVSHEFGRGNLRELKRAANASYHLGLAWNLLTATVFLLMRNWIPWLFTPDEQVVQVAAWLLVCTAFFQFSDGRQNISIGILRGVQDVSSTMRVAFISYILINLPVGYMLAFPLGMGPVGLWIGFIVGLSVAAVLLNARFIRIYRSLRLAQR